MAGLNVQVRRPSSGHHQFQIQLLAFPRRQQVLRNLDTDSFLPHKIRREKGERKRKGGKVAAWLSAIRRRDRALPRVAKARRPARGRERAFELTLNPTDNNLDPSLSLISAAVRTHKVRAVRYIERLSLTSFCNFFRGGRVGERRKWSGVGFLVRRGSVPVAVIPMASKTARVMGRTHGPPQDRTRVQCSTPVGCSPPMHIRVCALPRPL